jgi:uncharacterized protein YutE (UPF0331/DUF86 family)
VLDNERVLSKIAELDSYLGELKQVSPASFDEYQTPEKKQSCERLLQLCIECVLDVCKMVVSGLRLGLPSDENDLFNRLQAKKFIPKQMAQTLREMKSFRNILIHDYAVIDDELVFSYTKTRLDDFDQFKKRILAAILK